MTSDKYANRTTRVEHHYHNTYGDRYDYYRSQPPIYVGGGYSPLFWYCMMDWSLDRRAMWMYHNQNTMDRALYQQQLAENAQLKAEIAKLEAAGTAVDPGYVDKEFKDNPDLMYTDEYVTAAYNPSKTVIAPPPAVASPGVGAGTVILIVIIVLLIVWGLWWLIFKKNW